MKLLPKEKLILQIHPHILFLILPIIGIGFLWIGLFFVCSLYIESQSFCLKITSFLFLGLVLVFLLDWLNNLFFLTNFRVIKQRGIIGKQEMSIWLSQIQDIKASYSILGRIFGFGNLRIQSAGTQGELKFKRAPRPWKIKNLIENEIRKHTPNLK
jgi:uncharacterized membrane protein YdbT with pleckstrin-like domain